MNIEIKNLYCRIFSNLNLSIPNNSIIIGASGGGKSTILHTIANLIDYEGTVCKYDYKIGIVFQEKSLFPHWTVLENLYYPLHINKKITIEEAKIKAMEIIKMFNMEDFIHNKNLSGGQAQRVAILREILLDRDLILFDEPTSALDSINTNLFLKLVKNIKFIIATHDLNLARNIGEYFIFIYNGMVLEEGTDILKAPKTKELREFLC